VCRVGAVAAVVQDTVRFHPAPAAAAGGGFRTSTMRSRPLTRNPWAYASLCTGVLCVCGMQDTANGTNQCHPAAATLFLYRLAGAHSTPVPSMLAASSCCCCSPVPASHTPAPPLVPPPPAHFRPQHTGVTRITYTLTLVSLRVTHPLTHSPG
jgi:hypothetical protein